MIWKCQRNNHPDHPGYWHIHQVEAPDEGTARVKMSNLSLSHEWLKLDRTTVWSDEDWRAL